MTLRLFSRKPDWRTLGGTYESAFRVVKRKSLWMVEYLRARRSGDSLLSFYRRQHLQEKAGG